MKYIKIICLVLISLVFFLPLFTGIVGVKSANLSGVTAKNENSNFNFTNILSQSFQNNFEKSFQKFTKITGYLIRTDNQLNFLAFKQISSSPASNVLLGKHNHLFERPYLRNANRVGKYAVPKLTKVVEELLAFQQKLKSNGIGFLLIISPNKPSFYPEIIPSWYSIPGREKRYENREFIVEELARQGVNFIDGYDFLKQKEAELKQPMFATSGTHWNQLAGCLVGSEILRKSAIILGKPLTQLNCQIVGERPRAAYSDTDLLRVANLWYPGNLLQPAPAISAKGVLEEGLIKPKILFIGSSFVWELLRQFEASKVLTHTEFLYYFKRRVIAVADKGKTIERAKFDYTSALQNKDLVVIEINQSYLGRTGFTFPEGYLNWNADFSRLK